MAKQMYKNESNSYLKKTGELLKNNIGSLIVFLVVFFMTLLISFFNVATSETVHTFSLSEYEIGQIADRTIEADRALPADADFPFSISKGEKITKKGFPITEDIYQKLTKMAMTPTYIDYRAFGNSALYFMLLSVFMLFLFSPVFTGREIKLREAIFYALAFIVIYGITVFGTRATLFSKPYSLTILIPTTFIVILITILYGQKSAVYFSFLSYFAVLQAAGYNPIPAIFVLCSCISAVSIVRKIDRRFDIVIAAILLAVLNAVFLFTLKILFNSGFDGMFFDIVGVAFNGFISGILALGFLTPLEMLLNTASVFRLMDLSDLNNPLMKKMLITAPGTYNHSMMVATLAENACRVIGANPLLARVGAYYHDLGKIDQPEYFVENQSGDNKHTEMNNPRLSVSVIRSHVKKGVEKAHQLRLPEEVIDIISEHHGNSLISFFYNEAKKIDDQVSIDEFSYIGSPPNSKEGAVVMLADTVEAACRTLDKPSTSRLEKFIHQLVMSKHEHQQLDNSNLTFRELSIIEESFVSILAGYYHTRIEYPDQKDPDEV